MGSFDNYQTHSPHHLDAGLTPEEQLKDLGVDQQPKLDHYLDGPKVQKWFRMVLNWWNQEKAQQSEIRRLRLKAHAYYDGDQWDEEDAAEVETRGQDPRVFNCVKPTVDWICGTEKRTRIDYRILPRERNDAKGAESKTKLLKYVSDVNKSGFARSRAFEDATISGLGWIEVGIRSDETEEPLFYRYEDWRNVWYDSLSVERDMSDARFLFRAKYVDLDIAVSMFPERAGEIKASSIEDETFYDDELETGLNLDREITEELAGQANTESVYNKRSRVRLVECWYRTPIKRKILRGKNLGSLDGAEFTRKNKGMVYLVDEGYATVYDAIQMSMRHMVFTGKYVLQEKEFQYRHNRFPLVPTWGYRKKKDNSPYGAVLNTIDPQDDLNKRYSKAMYLFSTNKAIVDDNATDDWDEFYDEMQKPDGIIRKKPNSFVEIRDDRIMAEEHVMLMRHDKEYIESTGGVTDESRGLETNAISGKAIRARQEQSHITNMTLLDNYRYSFQLDGEIQLSLIEQFYTDEKTVRLVGDKGQLDFVQINQQNEQGEIENDITATQADFVVDAMAYSATIRQAMFESMGEILGKLDPQISIQLLDLWVDLSDLPGKDVMVQRIRKINGQPDPDEDENDPEAQQRKAAQQQMEQWQAQMEQKLAELEIAEKEAATDKDRAAGEQMRAKVKEILAKIDEMRKTTTIKKAEVLHKIETTPTRPATP